jgi:hypothetical protein
VTVSAFNNAGKTNRSSAQFTIDSLKPVLNILTPVASSWSNITTQTASWTATDSGSGMAYYLVKIDNGAWFNLTGQSMKFTGLTSAQHILDVRAYDRAGNFNETAWLFFVDTTLPTITFLTPAQGGAINSHTANVTWKGDDLSRIADYLIKIDGGVWTDVALNTTSSFGSLAEGSHVVIVRAQDKAGNWNQNSLFFAVDLTNPTVVAHSPTGGDAFMSGTVASLTVTFSEKMNATSVKITVNGKAGNVTSPDNVNFVATFQLSYNLPCTVKMTGQDVAGNPVNSTWSFTTMKNEGYIEGVLKNAHGDPITNATVTLSNGMSVQTDSKGQFKFSNVTAGTFLLKCVKDGFPPITQTVTSTAGKVNNLGSISFVPSGSSSDGSIFFVALAILFIAILALVLVIRRRTSTFGDKVTRPAKTDPMMFKENVSDGGSTAKGSARMPFERSEPVPKDFSNDPAAKIEVPVSERGKEPIKVEPTPQEILISPVRAETAPAETYNAPAYRFETAPQESINIPNVQAPPKQGFGWPFKKTAQGKNDTTERKSTIKPSARNRKK